jgi:hypothetical protein
MNLRDSVSRNPSDLIVFNKFIFHLNNSPVEELKSFLEQNDICEVNIKQLEKARSIVEQRNIVPNCGSDSTGRNRLIPGMGFIRSSKICEKIKQDYLEKHVILPQPISTLYLNSGKWLAENDRAHHESIVCMGKQIPIEGNIVGDEIKIEKVGLRRFWQYLNPDLKNFTRLTIGFIVALYWMFIYQFLRNVLVDLIAASGTDWSGWTRKNINFDNAYQSVFWTGFSVPVLGLVKQNFDLLWPGVQSGMFFEASKFFCICIANGIYISTHNRLRNFDKSVIRGNFFRSVLSWPIATAFAPIGNLLAIPSIVQAKFWSDVVAGFIEGGNKFSNRFTLRKRDLTEILPKLHSVWARAPRGKSCLRLLLLNKPSLGERIWQRKKEDPKEVEARSLMFKNCYDRLLEMFGNAGMLNVLTDYALMHFHGRDAVELTNLIGEEAENFLEWLKHLNFNFTRH